MSVVDDVQTLSRGSEFLPSSFYFLPCCCSYSVHQKYEWMDEWSEETEDDEEEEEEEGEKRKRAKIDDDGFSRK